MLKKIEKWLLDHELAQNSMTKEELEYALKLGGVLAVCGILVIIVAIAATVIS